MQHIKTVRKTGFTIAPEAGSQRLRDVINKNITAQDIYQTVQDAFTLGWNVIKLYFMIGLPTETQEDLEDLVALTRELSLIKRPGGKKNTINVSVATMIPKPHTPFQWASQISIAEGWEKISWLKNALRSPHIRLKWQNPEVSYIEGLMARGDRRMADLILHAYHKGCRLDGWSDHFRFDLWEESIRDFGMDASTIVYRQRAWDEVFPWDHIDMKVKRAYLWDEWQQALRGQVTEDCRDGVCQDCGVCDFTAVKPRIYPASTYNPVLEAVRTPLAGDFQQFQISFTKTGDGRFWGHLEMVNIFVRALRRAGITLKFSEGFHPKPKMVFSDALPIGMESLAETMVMTVVEGGPPEDLASRLNAELPAGLRVTDCKPYTKADHTSERSVVYRITLNQGAFDPQALQRFQTAAAVYYQKTNRKGQLKKIDLKAMVHQMTCLKPDSLEMEILHPPEALLRPDVVLRHVFELPSEVLRQARIIKLRHGRPHADNSPLTA
jgi:radical SAM-linked protein